jgi:multidrug efflux system membrane fusion protein
LSGRVTEVSGAADANSGMFGIEVSLDPADLPLKSGLVAKLTIIPSTAKVGERVYVPIGAIVEGNGRKAQVFVLDQKHARRREVEVAFIEGDRVALATGLQAGEQVITDGAQYLEDGEEVAIAEPVASQGRSAP